jgi:hypothetical protein
MVRHNHIVASPSTLTLSEVVDGEAHNLRSRGSSARSVTASDSDVPAGVPSHVCNPRLCATCMPVRFAAIRTASHARVNAAAVAAKIARTPGHDVWPAVLAFKISYRHALAIRAGWRGGGRQAAPIPYASRGYINGQRPGWLAMRELRVIKGGRHEEMKEWTRTRLAGFSA